MGGDLSELDQAIEDLQPEHPDFIFAVHTTARRETYAEAVRTDGSEGLYAVITASPGKLRAALDEAA